MLSTKINCGKSKNRELVMSVEKDGSRNTSLDVLRCLLMFGVILTHVCAFCQYGVRVPYEQYAVADCLTHPSVDGFAALSGWFGVKCSWKKLWKLGSLIFFCGTLVWILHELGVALLGESYRSLFGAVITHHSWGYECYRFWYLGAYLKLMVLSIVLNPILARITKLKKIWIILIGMSFVGLSYGSTAWVHWESHSPRTIIFIYIVVRFIMMFDFAKKVKTSKTLHRTVGALLLACLLMIALNAHYHLGFSSGNYANPLVILTGFLAVAWFSALNVSRNSLVSKFCALAAPSVVSIYMLHCGFTHSSFVPIPRYLMGVMHSILAFLTCAIILFCFCLGFDLIRRYCLSFVREHGPRNGVWSWLLS